ncbi:MAG: ADP-ribosyltransferase, partial [Paracoccus sp. (in: a-proteobacteria)]
AALENDVEAFLDALVARKNRMADDFTALYEKAAKARAKAIPGWKPKAPKVTPGKAKWVGQEKPTPPPPPVAPAAQTAEVFDSWLADAKALYTAFSGKDLEASNNWARFRRVVDDLDESAVDELLARSYLDATTAAEARALIAKAKAKRADLEAAYKRAQADHQKAVQAYKNDLADWKDANGVQDLTQGMDDGVLRHDTDSAGMRWAEKNWDGDRYKGSQRKWLKSYTGSYYDSLNAHLRSTGGKPTEMLDAVKNIDNAMAHISIPEDVILHRGVGAARPGQPQGSPYTGLSSRQGKHDPCRWEVSRS